MEIQWITAFLDRPKLRFEETVNFWATVSGSTLSSGRGEHGEFATLLPRDGGDAHLRVQGTRGGTCGSHIDLHVSDVRKSIEECVRLGASTVADHEAYAVLATPGAMDFCVVAHRGERTRQQPVVGPSGTTTLVDQVCIDVDPDILEDEVRFWSAITGWEPRSARTSEFVPLGRPPSMPLRLMFQVRDRPTGASSCHLDLACEDKDAAATDHESFGAVSGARHRYWTVMTDPAKAEYCLTS